MNSKEVREQMGNVHATMATMRSEIGDNVFSPEQQEKWDKLNGDYNELNARAQTLERVESFDSIKLVKDQPIKRAYQFSEQESDDALRTWVLNAAGKQHLVRDSWKASFDRSNLGYGNTLNLVSRAQSKTVGEGGYTVDGTMIQWVEKSLKDFSAVRGVAKVIKTENGSPLGFPLNDDTGNAAALVAENTPITDVPTVFTQKTIGAYKFAALIQPVSIELLQDSAVSISEYLGAIIGERIARLTDGYFTTGTGSGQPEGIAYASTKGGDTAGATGAVTYEEILDLIHSVDVAYRKGAQCKFMMHDLTLAEVRKILDGDDRPLWQPNLIPGVPETLLGYPVVVNNSMDPIATNVKSILFGALDKHLIREVSNLEVKVLTERYAEYAAVGFLALYRADSKLLNVAAVKHILQA